MPPLVVVVPAIVPLLPGLQIYKGLALFADGQDGVLPLASALATAFALAAGVILGQYLAQPLRGRRTGWRPGSRARAWSVSSAGSAPEARRNDRAAYGQRWRASAPGWAQLVDGGLAAAPRDAAARR